MDLISKNHLNKERSTLLNSQEESENKIKILNEDFLKIRYSANASVILNKKEKTLILEQSKKDDWFLILDSNLQDFMIELKGYDNNPINKINSQRFNENGLTGCLTIFNSSLRNISLKADKGYCEDAINIVSSEGDIKTIYVKEASYDALDIDFSNISIGSVLIENAGNDCVDLSSGKYLIDSLLLDYCSDKAISVGEASTLDANNIEIIQSEIGVSSKDSSRVNINLITTNNVSICLEGRKKKQEFNGASILVSDQRCNNKSFYTDKNSSIIF
jgi:hypothetical protein